MRCVDNDGTNTAVAKLQPGIFFLCLFNTQIYLTNGPLIDSLLILYDIIPKRSSNPIQLIHCLPVPTLPPNLILKGGSIFASIPPAAPKTTPILILTTLIPACFAISVAFSH
jgi:hypothetical protein